jgi:hypothetical protein
LPAAEALVTPKPAPTDNDEAPVSSEKASARVLASGG